MALTPEQKETDRKVTPFVILIMPLAIPICAICGICQFIVDQLKKVYRCLRKN